MNLINNIYLFRYKLFITKQLSILYCLKLILLLMYLIEKKKKTINNKNNILYLDKLLLSNLIFLRHTYVHCTNILT